MVVAVSALAPPPALVPALYEPLPLGTIQASGWLLRQLTQQANSLSGHLALFWKDVNNSVWVGGTDDKSGAGHERGPYWLNGLVPLVAILNASSKTPPQVDIAAQVDGWISYILNHQNASGWLGPDDSFGGAGNDYWNAWNVVASLLQYADARPAMAARCYKAVLEYVAEASRRMRTQPLSSWSQNRWQDWVLLVQWTLDVAPLDATQTTMLHDAASLAYEQRWDWQRFYARDPTYARSTKPQPPWTAPSTAASHRRLLRHVLACTSPQV